MKKIQFITMLCTLVCFSAFGQNKVNDIPIVELVDTELISEIENVISEQKSLHAAGGTGFFADGKGYIIVEVQNYYQSDTANRYFIYPNQNAIEEDNLPNAVTFVNDRPVLVYYSNSSRVYKPAYSAKNIENFHKIIDPFLAKPEHIKARDESGKVVIDDTNFRESYSFSGPTRVLLTFRNNTSKSVDWRDGEPIPL